MSPAKTAEPIEMLFWDMDSKKHVKWGAHWCQLANTIEPFTCGGDAAFSQITFTTRSYFCNSVVIF